MARGTTEPGAQRPGSAPERVGAGPPIVRDLARRALPRPVRRRLVQYSRMARDGRFPGIYFAERLRERMEGLEETRQLLAERASRELCWETDDEPEPLVTIRIATYDRGPLVAERAIDSAVHQSYERLEILVVGDHCDEATERAVRGVHDPRVVFVNLPVRGCYPAAPYLRWMVAGVTPMNAGLLLAQGKWIAPCDDDDELTEDHVELLLQHVRAERLELVWSQADFEGPEGEWHVVGSEPLAHGSISHGTVLYSSHLRHFRHNITSWKLNEPADWNLWKRMSAAGVRMGFLPRVTYRHYLDARKLP